jgi:hypothetical protein
VSRAKRTVSAITGNFHHFTIALSHAGIADNTSATLRNFQLPSPVQLRINPIGSDHWMAQVLQFFIDLSLNDRTS